VGKTKGNPWLGLYRCPENVWQVESIQEFMKEYGLESGDADDLNNFLKSYCRVHKRYCVAALATAIRCEHGSWIVLALYKGNIKSIKLSELVDKSNFRLLVRRRLVGTDEPIQTEKSLATLSLDDPIDSHGLGR